MTINVTKYRLNPDRVFAGTRGSYGMEKLSFVFDGSWDFDTISVTFHPQRSKPIRVPYLPGAEIDIPAEVMAYSGESRFVVSGVTLDDEDGTVERKIITLEGHVGVEYTPSDEGGNTEKVTPDTYDLFLAEATEVFDTVRKDVERSAAEAAESASDAEGFANEAEESKTAAAGSASDAAASQRKAAKSETNAASSASSAKSDAGRAELYHEGALVAWNEAVNAASEAVAAAQSADVLLDRVEEFAGAAENSAMAASKEADRAEQTVMDALQAAKDSGEFDGENGDTPYIGENGNWWIGDTDTGVKAEALNPIDKTALMTQPVGRDEAGRLWTRPGGDGGGGSGGGTSYDIGYGLVLDSGILSAEVGADSFAEISNAKLQEIFNKAMEG